MITLGWCPSGWSVSLPEGDGCLQARRALGGLFVIPGGIAASLGGLTIVAGTIEP